VVLTSFGDEARVHAALEMTGYLLIDVEADEVAAAINAATEPTPAESSPRSSRRGDASRATEGHAFIALK
jgi:DNA-binding NarL/FixJ family response regulator